MSAITWQEEQAQENLRTDLFGEDDEDAIAPHSQVCLRKLLFLQKYIHSL